MNKKDCPIFFRQYFPFWDKLTAPQQDRLCAATHPARYEKGENVHGMGGCTGVLVVESGCLRGYLLSEEGREITLFRAFPGEVCILSAPCALRTFSLDVMIDAEEDSSLLVIDGPEFAGVARENLYAENFALSSAAGRLSDAVWVMQQILFMRFDQRLAVFLLEESEKDGPVLKLTHDQIARYMGSAREVVSRMLRYFTSEGIVRVSRGTVEVIDK
ncbi:MAG TPA: Crp/Fnr family transcriptional regulator, partial [Candidatus Faecivivens stercoravium]|nr:Crp/Fnr family transcriptional regulator [Candidatus Faecivivens stercoravium]